MAKTLKNGFKKFKKKRYALILLVILASFFAFFLTRKENNLSTFSLDAKQNKFHLAFLIQDKDKEKALKTTQALNLSQSILEGVEFEIDDISTVKLAALTPINGDLEFQNNRVLFSASYDFPPRSQTFTPETSLKIPNSAKIVIFKNNLQDLISQNYILPNEFKTWLNNNIKSQNGQYLFIFSKNDFALIIKPQDIINLSSLAEAIPQNTDDSPYKQETDETINYHLYRIPNSDTTFTFFEMGEFTYMTSSLDIAKQIVASQKENSSVKFLDSQAKPVEFALLFRNTDSKDPEALNFLSLNSDNIKPLFQNIDELLFISTGKDFSGHLDISQ